MLYADDANVFSNPGESLANVMEVIVNVIEATGLTLSEKKAETMLLGTPNQILPTSPLVVEAAGQRYKQTGSFGTWAALSMKPPTFCQRTNDESDTRGRTLTVQAGAVLYRDRSIHSEGVRVTEGVRVEGRYDGDAVVWVCDVSSRRGALRYALQRPPQAPSSDHCLPSLTTHRSPHVVCQNPQEGATRGR